MAASKAQIQKFLDMIVPIAMEQSKKHGYKIFASVCIAQAAHESGWGTSAKMVKANALFGVKVGKSAYKFGTAWKGKAYKTGTTEYYDGKNPTKITDFFRAYDNVIDATEDYMDMLCHCNRYKAALNQSSPQKCIEAIVKGGYATGPSYAQAIMKLINAYGLTKHDVKQTTQPLQQTEPVQAPAKETTSAEVYSRGTYVTVKGPMKLRKGPGTENAQNEFKNMTSAAKKLNSSYEHTGKAYYGVGVTFSAMEVTRAKDGSWWGRTPSGWICLADSKNIYCKKK